MAVVADRVIVELEAKIDRYDANVRRAEQTFAKATDNIARNATRTSGLVTASFRAIGAGLTVAAALAVGRAFLDIADRAKNMEASLRLATAASGSYAVAMQDVLRISEQTRSGLNEVATLYASFARGAKDLGISQAQVATITQTVGQAFTVSGTAAGDASNAIRQLSQAFASGVLRGDEFNSIMENAPRLARLLADSLDIPIGSLRAMAEAGQLTADKLVTAFSDRRFTAGLQAEFDQMPVTFDQAMTLVSNSAQITFSAFDRGGEFSKAIANFVVDGSSGFGDMATAAENMGIRVRSEFAGIAAAVGPVIDAIHGLASALDGLGSFSADGPKGFIEGTFQDIDAATNYLSKRTFGSTLFGNGTNFAGRYRSARDKSAGERRLGLIMGADIYAGNEQYRPKQTVTAPRPGAAKAGPKGRKRAGGGAKTTSPLDPEAFEREEAQLNIEILRDKARAADATVRNADAAEASATFEIEALNAQQAREKADTERDKRYTAEQKAKLVALQDTAYAMQRAAVIAQRDVEIAERNSRALRENQNLEISALEGQKRLARSRQERLALENSILDILEQQEAAELEVLIAQGKVLDATKARGDLAAQQAGRRAEAARDSESPLQRYSRRLDKTPDELRDDAEELVVEQLQEVQDGITDAIAGAIGTKNSLIKGLIGLFVEQVIMRPIADAFSQASSGGGGLGGILGSVFGSIFSGTGSTGNGTGFGGPLGGSRASGGNVVGGRLYRVNEGGGVEGFRPAGSGTIIPLGRMRSQASGVRLYQTVQVDARGSVNPDGYAEHIKAAVRRETVAIVGAGMRQVTQGVPARLAQFQRDGT